MSIRPASRRHIALLSALAILLGLVWVGAGASAAPPKPFRADFDSSPSPIPAGSTATITVTIFNDTTPQQLGSSDVFAPAGYLVPPQTITLPSGTATVVNGTKIQLRNLAIPALGSLSFQFTAVAPCAGNPAWSLDAKQSNDHTGPPGNNFVLNVAGSDLVTELTGTCSLAFSTPPANAEMGGGGESEPITGTAFDPEADPVAVEVLDANGDRITTSTAAIGLSLGGGTSGAVLRLNGSTAVTATASQGVATFAGLTIDLVGFNYTLTASSPSIDPATSGPFHIAQAGQVCTGATCASPRVSNGSNTASGDALATNVPPGTELLVAFIGDDPCSGTGYVPVSPDTFTVLALDEAGDPSEGVVLQITLVIDGDGRRANQYEFCYATDVEGKTFTDKFGNQVSQGLLPLCQGQTVMNCIVSRDKNRTTGEVTVTAVVLDGKGRI